MTSWYWIAAIGLTAAALAASAALYPALPERIPIHWNIHGQPDNFGSKEWAAFLTPMIMAGMLVVFRLLPWLSPARFEVDSFRRTYLFAMVVVTGLLAYIHGVSLYAAFAPRLDVGRMILAGLFLFALALGNVMGKIRRNFYIGIRTPWTLASERVWTDTHRLAAWTMVMGGMVGLVATLAGAPFSVSLAIFLLAMLLPVPYSLIRYKLLERQGKV